ncbi:MAG: alpha/beta hydrolase [Bdellovibrionaceae bacterium]|nr:alpha/beta hydrolase [Pseudobdellovibrionaceae bacterium]
MIISIHGLWGNDAQFARTIGSLSHIVSSADHNAIGLTLPGHKKEFFDESYLDLIKKNTPFATHDQWLVALQHTLRVARQLGQKTIIVGQSTGGLLAVYAALKHSELVDQIVLIEPALQVRSLMNFGSCLSASIPEEVIKGLGLLIGVPVPDGVSIKMGCEVQKVADLLFPRRFEHRGRGPRAEVRYIEDFSTYTKVAAQVRVPVLMINNENDRIVSTEANRNFFAGLTTGKQYISINKDGKMPHGRVTSAQPETLANQLIEFTYHHLRESTLGNIYLYRVGQRLRSHRYALCATWDSLQTCLENYRTRAAAADRFTAELRTIIQNEAEFERVLSVIDFLDTFWLRQIHQGLQNGKKILNDVHEEVQKTRPDGIEKLREAEIFLEDVTKNFTKDI